MTNKKKANKNETLNFEKTLEDLSNIVENMERDELSLEDSLKLFEEGIQKTRECHKALKTAEQKVTLLTKENEKLIETAFDEFDEDE